MKEVLVFFFYVFWVEDCQLLKCFRDFVDGVIFALGERLSGAN
jgi:hypothetical protein